MNSLHKTFVLLFRQEDHRARVLASDIKGRVTIAYRFHVGSELIAQLRVGNMGHAATFCDEYRYWYA